jgi:hypothetical protein
MTWTGQLFYIFAPFSLMGRILQKIEEDKTQAVIIAPVWPTQAWWPTLINLVRRLCYLLPQPKNILKLEHKPEMKYPLTKTNLIAFDISGQPFESKEYHKSLKNSLLNLGGTAQENNIIRTLRNGFILANGKQIPLNLIHKQ